VFTRIDHLMICVPDLARGMEQYRRMGFNVQPGGAHPGKGTHNAIAFNDEDYLELLAVRDPAEYAAASSWGGGLPAFIAAGGGIRYAVLQSDDLAADVAAMRARGVDVSDAMDGSRRTPDGKELKWKAAVLGPKNLLPIFFIQHLTPLAERKRVTHHSSPVTHSGPTNPIYVPQASVGGTSMACSPVSRTPRAGGGMLCFSIQRAAAPMLVVRYKAWNGPGPRRASASAAGPGA